LFRSEVPTPSQEPTAFDFERLMRDSSAPQETASGAVPSDAPEDSQTDQAAAPELPVSAAAEAAGDEAEDMSVEDYMQQLLSRLRTGPVDHSPSSKASARKHPPRAGSGDASNSDSRLPTSGPAAPSVAGAQATPAPSAASLPSQLSAEDTDVQGTVEAAALPRPGVESPNSTEVPSPAAEVAGVALEPSDTPDRSAPAMAPRGWNGQALSEELARLRELELDMRSIRSVANNTVDMVLLAADRSRWVRNLAVQLLLALVGVLTAVGCSLVSDLATHLQVLGTGIGSVVATYAGVKAAGSYQELIKLNRKRTSDGSGEISADKV
jgi:hypothetical protein